jgi:hypothetical protein
MQNMYDVKSKQVNIDYSEMTCKGKSEAQSLLLKTQKEIQIDVSLCSFK